MAFATATQGTHPSVIWLLPAGLTFIDLTGLKQTEKHFLTVLSLLYGPTLTDSKESSPTPQFKSIDSLELILFMVQLSRPYMTAGKTIPLTR